MTFEKLCVAVLSLTDERLNQIYTLIAEELNRRDGSDYLYQNAVGK